MYSSYYSKWDSISISLDKLFIILIIFVTFFNKTFTDELSSIKSAFQSTHDKTASLIERMNTEITSKENSIKELQYEIKEIEDIKAQADNFVTNLKKFFIVTNQGGLKSDFEQYNFRAKL